MASFPIRIHHTTTAIAHYDPVQRNQIPEIHYDSPRSAPLGLVPGRWRSPSPGERSLPKLLSTRTSPVGVDSSNVVLGTSLLYIDINSLYIMSMGVGGLHTWDRELLWMRCRNLMHRQPRTCFLFDRTTRFMSDRSRGVDCCIPATSVTTVVMAQLLPLYNRALSEHHRPDNPSLSKTIYSGIYCEARQFKLAWYFGYLSILYEEKLTLYDSLEYIRVHTSLSPSQNATTEYVMS